MIMIIGFGVVTALLLLVIFLMTQSQKEHQLQSLLILQESVQKNIRENMSDVREQLSNSLVQQSDFIGKQINTLTQQTQEKLTQISGQVEKRLVEGFEKTNATFTDVVKRLALIDQAQQRITELSTNVVSLQEVLSDKKSRGAFGEVQLSALLHNVLPEKHFQLQATLSNGKRADALLILPNPTGNIAIDAKFPLENYRKLIDSNLSTAERKIAEQQFKQDIKKHISDVQEKYIIPNETADGAMLFIPAEAVFAELHAHHSDLIEEAQRARVWIVSPTTMMAVLTTARAVLKDAATRKQVHIIQEQLVGLSKDFERFQKRMENLAQHIRQAKEDVDDVQISSEKITNKFKKIENVELNSNLTLE